MAFFFSTFFLIQACVVCFYYFHLPIVTVPRLHPLKLSEFTLPRPCDKSKEQAHRGYTCKSALKSINQPILVIFLSFAPSLFFILPKIIWAQKQTLTRKSWYKIFFWFYWQGLRRTHQWLLIFMPPFDYRLSQFWLWWKDHYKSRGIIWTHDSHKMIFVSSCCFALHSCDMQHITGQGC